MPYMAFFALWGVFFFRGRSDICGYTFGGSKAIFGGSPLVFFVRCCGLRVAFCFAMLCNASKTVCIAFSFLFGISYRLNFSVPCRRFILALNGIPIFYHIFPYYTTIFYQSALFRSEVGSKGRLLFSAFA